VSISATSPIPPGWYPDPAGARQWRVWTGTTWSDATRPYGERVDAARPAGSGYQPGGMGLVAEMLTPQASHSSATR
jgi:hypothetical protein